LSKQREGLYKTQLTGRIYDRFGDRCVVLRMDANNRQGIPDILVIFEGGYWAALEAKTSEKAPHQPNQPYYVARLGNMCFAAFIYPENEEAVLNELQQEYETHWATRIS
jgi:hypothetical protein